MDDIEISYDKNGIPNVSLKSGFTYKRLDSSFINENNKDLPVILFFHDSYSAEFFIGKYFAQQFGKAIFIHFGHISKIQEYINQFKPDIVVFESAERELGWFANCVIGIPELSK